MSDTTPTTPPDGPERPAVDTDAAPPFDEAGEVELVGGALERLLEDDESLPQLEEALHTGDTAAFLGVLERHDLLDRAAVICRWVCTWHVQRRCEWVCRDHQLEELEPEQLTEFGIGFAELASRDGALDEIVDAIDRGDGDGLAKMLESFGLRAYCRLVCVLVLTVRCELFCLAIAGGPRTQRPRKPVDVLTDLAGAVGQLAKAEQLDTVVRAYEAGQYDRIHRVLGDLQLGRWCRLICVWLCVVVPVLHCIRVCRPFPHVPIEELPRSGDPGPIRDWAKATIELAQRSDQLSQVMEAVRTFDDRRLSELIREFGLQRWCHVVCFWLHRVVCYRRCFLICPPRPPLPLFYKLGAYSFPSAVDTSAGGTGLTLADGRAFYATVRLNGSALQQSYDGGQPEYRFEVDAGAGWTPVLPHQIAATTIGSWTAVGATARDYVVNGNAADPDQIVVTPAADGWIRVPTEASYWSPQGAFTSNGNFIRLHTTTVAPGTTHDVSTIDGGDSVPAGLRGTNQEVGIRMRWRKVGDAGDGLITGVAHVVAVNNDRWDDVAKGGSWLGQREDGQMAVVSVDVDEIGPGCDEIDDELHVRYTAAHPQLGAVSLTMDGPVPASLAMTDGAGASADDRFGVAESTPAPADLPDCTYLVTLSASLLLTTGDGSPNPVEDQVAFHVEH